MHVRDIMTTSVLTARPGMPVAQAADIMTRNAVTALPVLDDDDRLVGIVSEGDLLWHRVPSSPDAHLWRRPDDAVTDPPGTVGELMTRSVIAVSPGADLAGVAEILAQNDVRSVPVVLGSTVVGVISRRDVLRTLERPAAD